MPGGGGATNDADEDSFTCLTSVTDAGTAESDAEAVNGWKGFYARYQRNSRALRRSLETERGLVGMCRELKAALVQRSLQLQAALALKRDDDSTIARLRNEARRAWDAADQAKGREEAAVVLVDRLRSEVETLRVQMSELSGSALASTSAAAQSATLVALPGKQAHDAGSSAASLAASALHAGEDDDSLFTADGRAAAAAGTGAAAALAQRVGPFQEWKAAHHLWSPDTPAAAAHADEYVKEGGAAVAASSTTGLRSCCARHDCSRRCATTTTATAAAAATTNQVTTHLSPPSLSFRYVVGAHDVLGMGTGVSWKAPRAGAALRLGQTAARYETAREASHASPGVFASTAPLPRGGKGKRLVV